MGVRILCCDARALSQMLTLLPTSVQVMGSIMSQTAGEVALIVAGPEELWPAIKPMPIVEMIVDDKRAGHRIVKFREKSVIERPERPAIILNS